MYTYIYINREAGKKLTYQFHKVSLEINKKKFNISGI